MASIDPLGSMTSHSGLCDSTRSGDSNYILKNKDNGSAIRVMMSIITSAMTQSGASEPRRQQRVAPVKHLYLSIHLLEASNGH